MANPISRDFIARPGFNALPGSQNKQNNFLHITSTHTLSEYTSRAGRRHSRSGDRNFSRVSDAAVMLNLLWMKSLPPSFRNELIAVVDLQQTLERQTPFGKTRHLICPPTFIPRKAPE